MNSITSAQFPRTVEINKDSKAVVKKRRKLKILEDCQSNFKTPQEVAEQTRIPLPTAYRLLRELAGPRDGRLVKKDGKYRTLAGTFSKDIESGSSGDRIGELLPHLRLFPTLLQRAYVELAMYGITARRARISEDNNPGLAGFGDTGMLKSTTNRAICLMAGADLMHAQITIFAEGGKSLTVRHNSKGEILFKREALSQPVVWVEEFQDADVRLKKDIYLLIHGRIEIPLQSETLQQMAFPILEFNQDRKATTIEGLTGLPRQRLRRLAIANFDNAGVTMDMVYGVGEFIEQIRALGPVKFPDPPRTLLKRSTMELIAKSVARCIRPEYQFLIDAARTDVFIRGARGYQSEDQAARRVLYLRMLLAESTGFTTPDWEEQLNNLFMGLGAASKASSAKGEEFDEQTNTYDLDAKLHKIKFAVEASGYDVLEDDQKIVAMLQGPKDLAEQGYSKSQYEDILSKIGSNIQMARWIKKYQLTPQKISDLGHVSQLLDTAGTTPGELEKFVRDQKDISDCGFSPAQALQMANKISEYRTLGHNESSAMDCLIQDTGKALSFTARVNSLEAEERDQQARNASAKEQFVRLIQRSNEIRNDNEGLIEENRKLRRERDDLEHECQEKFAYNANLEKESSYHQNLKNLATKDERLARERISTLFIIHKFLLDPEGADLDPRLGDKIKALCYFRYFRKTFPQLAEDAQKEICVIGREILAQSPDPDSSFEELVSVESKLEDAQQKLNATVTTYETFQLFSNIAFLVRVAMFPIEGEMAVSKVLWAEFPKLCHIQREIDSGLGSNSKGMLMNEVLNLLGKVQQMGVKIPSLQQLAANVTTSSTAEPNLNYMGTGPQRPPGTAIEVNNGNSIKG